MSDSWGRAVYRRRRLVLEIAAIAVAFVASWSTGVFGKLQSSGGFTPPGSQCQRSSDLAAAFGGDAGDFVVLYSSPTQTVRSPAFRAAVTSVLARLPRSRVDPVATYRSTGSPQFVSVGGRETFALIELAGSDDSARRGNLEATPALIRPPPAAPFRVDGPPIRLLPVQRASHPVHGPPAPPGPLRSARPAALRSARRSRCLPFRVDGPPIRLLPVQRASHPVCGPPALPAPPRPAGTAFWRRSPLHA